MHKKVHVFWTADDGTNQRITANTTGTKIAMIRVFIHRTINFSSRRSRWLDADIVVNKQIYRSCLIECGSMSGLTNPCTLRCKVHLSVNAGGTVCFTDDIRCVVPQFNFVVLINIFKFVIKVLVNYFKYKNVFHS